MLPLEHSAILSTFIKLPFVIKIFVLSVFEWPFKTGFTVFIFKVSYSRVMWVYAEHSQVSVGRALIEGLLV